MIKRETKYIIRRILIGVGVALILGYINACEVKAESISGSSILANTYLVINGTSYTDGFSNYKYISNGGTLGINVPNTNITYNNAINTNVWIRASICSVQDGLGAFTPGWSINNATSIMFTNTKISCIAGGYQGYVTFAKWKVTNIAYGTGFLGFSSEVRSTVQKNSSVLLLSVEFSFNDFPVYDTETEKLDKLDSILNAILVLNNNYVVDAITNQTQTITNAQINTTNAVNNNTTAINNMNDTINNSNVDSPNNSISEMEQNLPTNSVISDLLTLPVRMFQNIVNAIDGTCSPFSLGALFGTNLVLPCINIQNYLGSVLWGAIDVIFCGIFVLSMRKKFVEIFENITSLKNGGNELE